MATYLMYNPPAELAVLSNGDIVRRSDLETAMSSAPSSIAMSPAPLESVQMTWPTAPLSAPDYVSSRISVSPRPESLTFSPRASSLSPTYYRLQSDGRAMSPGLNTSRPDSSIIDRSYQSRPQSLTPKFESVEPEPSSVIQPNPYSTGRSLYSTFEPQSATIRQPTIYATYHSAAPISSWSYPLAPPMQTMVTPIQILDEPALKVEKQSVPDPQTEAKLRRLEAQVQNLQQELHVLRTSQPVSSTVSPRASSLPPASYKEMMETKLQSSTTSKGSEQHDATLSPRSVQQPTVEATIGTVSTAGELQYPTLIPQQQQSKKKPAYAVRLVTMLRDRQGKLGFQYCKTTMNLAGGEPVTVTSVVPVSAA